MIKYRSDIDGLRGLAVLLVLLFHVKAPYFAGGFIGVDIFMVISGYLITSLIMKDLEDGNFSFSEFYIRRVRRLFPALLATVVLSFIAAYVILAPHHLARMAGSAIYALTSLSNFYFWQERGYFDAEAMFKPLLHTWSLSVEEQYYLIWPLALAGLWRLRRFKTLMTTAIVVVIGASLWASQAMLSDDRGAAFFLTPFRVFEFGIGGSLYWLRRWPLQRPQLRAAAYAVGLGLIALSMALFHYAEQFPGLRALVPCVGAFLLLYVGEQNFVAKALDNALMVAIGKISYSLYLVHWPVISLYRSTTYAELSARERIAVLAVSLVLAAIFYFAIEKPFRYRRKAAKGQPSLRFALGSSMAALAACLPLAHAWASGGWSWRYPPELRAVAEFREKELVSYTWSNWAGFVGDRFEGAKTKVLIVGDSQASDVLNLMVEARLDRDFSIRVINMDYACAAIWIPPDREHKYYAEENALLKIDPPYAQACRRQRSSVFASPLIKEADVILWAPLWVSWNESYLDTTLTKLRSLTSASLVMVGSKVWSYGSIDIALRHRSIARLSEFGATFVPESTLAMNQRLKDMSERHGDTYFDLMRFLCPTREACYVLTPGMRPTLHNAGHYSMWGAAFVARMVAKPLTSLIQQQAELARRRPRVTN